MIPMKNFLGFLLFIVSVACATQGVKDIMDGRHELAAIFLTVAAITFLSSDAMAKG